MVIASTKSGSNSFHGSAFDYRRSGATYATDPFTQPQRPQARIHIRRCFTTSLAVRSVARSSRTSCSSSATIRAFVRSRHPRRRTRFRRTRYCRAASGTSPDRAEFRVATSANMPTFREPDRASFTTTNYGQRAYPWDACSRATRFRRLMLSPAAVNFYSALNTAIQTLYPGYANQPYYNGDA